MSFNDILIREDELNLSIKKSLLERKNNEGRNLLKKQILSLEEYEENLDLKLKPFNKFNQLFIEDVFLLKENIDYMHKKCMLAEDLLAKKVQAYSSETDNKHLLVKSKIKELRKKLNVLQGKKQEVSFLIKEDFLNLFNLSSSRLTKSVLHVDTESETLTLPVKSERNIKVNRIYISKNSNCIPGNYLDGSNKYIYSVVDKNEDTVFECFKEGEGPLVLEITLSFQKEEVVNYVDIGQLNTRGTSSIEIDSIVYTDGNQRKFNLSKLIDKNEQNLKIINSSNKENIFFPHIPVKAIQAKIRLKVKEYSTINGLNVFLMGLKTVGFKSIKYSSSGEIGSSVFNIPENYFEILFQSKAFPRGGLTYDLKTKVSVDNGGEYEEIPEGKSLLVGGDSKELSYNVELRRNAEALNKINEVINENYFVDIEAKTTVVNRAVSPMDYEYPFKKVLNDSFKVVQNKVLSRSDSLSRRVKLGRIQNTGINEFVLQTNLNSYEREDITVYINNQAGTYVENEASLTTNNTWSLDSNGKKIKVFSDKQQPILEVSILLKPELPVVIKKPEGYYLKIEDDFDFDPNTLVITCVNNLSEYIEETIPTGKKKIFLKNSYIDKNNFYLYQHDGEEASNWAIVSGNEYTLNNLDGSIIISDNDLPNVTKKVKYKYYKTNELNKKDYEIWVKGNDTKGVFIYPENISFEEKVEKLGEVNSERYYLFDGSYSAERAASNNDKVFVLSHTNIIKGSLNVKEDLFESGFKEVEFIDGFTEFLNVKKMEKDFVPSIEKNSEGKVVFSLQEEPFIVGAFSGKIYVYAKDGSVIPVSNLQTEGRTATLELQVADTTSRGYHLSYYYQGELEDIKMYSVDYLNGILYTSDTINENGSKEVSYKLGRVGIEYYIYNEIKNFQTSYENSRLSVRTEEFFEINNNIKFLAFKTKNEMSLEGIEEYFSPIVYNFEIGLN